MVDRDRAQAPERAGDTVGHQDGVGFGDTGKVVDLVEHPDRRIGPVLLETARAAATGRPAQLGLGTR